ncbi:MAG: hypothetical protein E4G91_01345 [Candidatus Zixiibacteriota bacterium]|nr:MAG: hypothetical protein E4G91_01345 [candidate division Zixibacteria bacterium]
MSHLNPEGGTGEATANSFASALEFLNYLSERGNTTLVEAEAEELDYALIKAADYMEQKFRLLWKGSRATVAQRLSWPRRGVDVPDFFDPFFRDLGNVPISFQDTLFIAENVIPLEVKEAQFLIAIQTFVGDVSTGVIQPPLGRVTKREKLGALEVEYFDAAQGSSRQTTQYWDAENTVEPFLALQRLFGGQLVRN